MVIKNILTLNIECREVSVVIYLMKLYLPALQYKLTNTMNKISALFMVMAMIFFYGTAQAQQDGPPASPLAKIEQQVGFTDIVIEYSRPAKKGRTLFVDVEKFGKIWRTGANASTKVSFSKDVTLEGKSVPAGQYALYSIPGETNWSVMLYSDLSLGGNVGEYDESKEVVRVNVVAEEIPISVENFTIDIGNITADGATLGLVWGNYYVPVKLGVKN